MMEKLDFLVRFWELKARHDLVGEPLSASEQIELLSLLQLVTGDLELPRPGTLPRPKNVIPAEPIGEGVIVGMGSVVFNDLPDNVVALGNPARPMRPNLEQRVFK